MKVVALESLCVTQRSKVQKPIQQAYVIGMPAGKLAGKKVTRGANDRLGVKAQRGLSTFTFFTFSIAA